MRSLHGAASCFYQLEQFEEALAITKDMLVLNEGDNQGARYIHVSALIALKKFAEAKRFLDKHKYDETAHMLYSRALVLFYVSKDKKVAEIAFAKAGACNLYIPALVLSPKLVPGGDLPDSYAIGSFEEAILYCVDSQDFWYENVELFKWFKCMCSMHMLATASGLEALKQEEIERERRERTRGKGGNSDNILDLNFFLNKND